MKPVKHPTKTQYRKAAMHGIPFRSYANRNQRLQLCRSPRGAWVEVWVLVPIEYALMEK